MGIHSPRKQPSGLLKWGYHAPIALYRLRLGWLLGHRFLMLTHRGRKSGAIHRTVLEVIDYHAATQESVVLSAYGPKADWYQNILASPPVEMQTARHRYIPQYRLLDVDERFAALQITQRRYRRAFRAVMRLFGYDYDGTEASLRALAQSVLVVRFRPRESNADAEP
jgi:deazaflavin-dependent oxidoreductase (nitroreductase family)